MIVNHTIRRYVTIEYGQKSVLTVNLESDVPVTGAQLDMISQHVSHLVETLEGGGTTKEDVQAKIAQLSIDLHQAQSQLAAARQMLQEPSSKDAE